jgi:V8-like Glu-specific endopeptidase
MAPWYCRIQSLLPNVVGPAILAVLAACSAAGGTTPTSFEGEYDPVTGTSDPIINNSGPANAYPYAALVDMGGGLCSGAVIAPRVAMTAGHCVDGASQWTVKTPYSLESNQPQVRKASGSWTEYQSWGGQVNPNTVDVALLFFDQGLAFTMPWWPKIQNTKLPNGSKVINVGRINNGQLSYSNLYVGPPISITASQSFPFDYDAQEIIQSGDSGGPVFLTGGKPHTIAAVNSGAGGGEILARTDVVYDKIQQMIAQHGGPGDGGGGGSGGSGGSGGGGTGGAAGSPGGGGTGGGNGGGCIAEKESNNTNKTAQSFEVGAICGAFAHEVDQDWFTWSVPGAGVSYTVSVEGSDAQVLMWKFLNGQYYTIANADAFTIKNTSNGGGAYYIAVWSPSGMVSPYKLTLTRSDMSAPDPGPGGSGGAGGSNNTGGSGGSNNTGGTAGKGGASGAGGQAGQGGSGGGTPPVGDMQWFNYPVQKNLSENTSSWGKVLIDIESHLPSSYGSQYRDSDWSTWAHETTHGINSDIRNNHNNTGKSANGLYVLNNMGVLIVEPNMMKSAVAAYVPQSLREFRFSTYITGQTAWDDMPTYILDEWVSYTNGTACAYDRYQAGLWTDGWRDESGNLEFVGYGIALGMAVKAKDPNYFTSYPQFKAFMKWHTERSMDLFQKTHNLTEFKADMVEKLYNNMKSASDAQSWRQFVRDTFGQAWAQQVMGF